MNNTSTSRRTVLITAHVDEEWQKRLQEISPDLHIEFRPDASVEDIPADVWQEVEVLFTLGSFPQPEQAPGLRWVQLYSAGANQAFEGPLAKSDVIFTTASGVHAVNIGEYVLTTMLAWFHRFPRFLEWKQKAEWPADAGREQFIPEELRGKTLNIVGYGSIGREVARLAKAFGMRILALEQREDHKDHGFRFPAVGDPEGTLPDHYYKIDQFHQALGESDVVVVAVPLTPTTRGMFDKQAFAAMKKTALLVNIARGDVCDEQALLQALQEQQIAGAVLDVFNAEPLPANSPLFTLSNVFMTPHISGLTPHYDERATQIFAENLRRYVKGEELYNKVDKGRGY